MQYVGKVLNTVTEFYKEINPATLSGAIDIVVVEQADGELACSPFHVRFGKLQLLRPQDKKVEIAINGKVVNFPMKVGDAGEAFFVFETEELVPDEYSTSPLVEPTEGEEEPEFLDIYSTEPISEENDTGYVSSHSEYDPGKTTSSYELEFGEADVPKNTVTHKTPSKSITLPNTPVVSPRSLLFGNETPTKDHIILDTAGYKAEDPKNVQEALRNMPTYEQLMEEAGEADQSTDIRHNQPKRKEFPAPEHINTGDDPKEFERKPKNESHPFRSVQEIDRDKKVQQQKDSRAGIRYPPIESTGNDDKRNSRLVKGQEECNPDVQGHFSDTELDSPVHTGKPSRRNSFWQSPLSDTELDYESTESLGVNASNEWSWNWGVPKNSEKISTVDGDEGVKGDQAKEDQVGFKIEGNQYNIGMSLCGDCSDFGKDRANDSNLFHNHMVSFDEFSENPSIVVDPRMVFYYESCYYTWPAIVPLFISLMIYHKPLPEKVFKKHLDSVRGFSSPKVLAANHQLELSKDTKRYSFTGSLRHWWSRSSQDLSEDDEDTNPTIPKKAQTYVGPVTASQVDTEATPAQKRYAKTLRLTSEQLKSLGLAVGVNTVTFSVSTGSQSQATCSSRIFFWKYDTKIVISDIDGTITKSDALGHLFTMVGKDWTHNGVAKLYSDISRNGFQFLYLTSRAIGQADTTRDYLRKVEQGPYQLPEGPVIMSPDRLFTSLHREVIMKQPQIFKMACLRDIKQLFGEHNPFYAGFGNRITDAISYRSVGVPVSRIFTIEYSGDLKLELLAGYKSSYIKLNDLVDQIFPPQTIALETEYNDWNYWKPNLDDIDIPELEEPEQPTNDQFKPENKRLGMLQSLTRIASRGSLSLYSNKSDEDQERTASNHSSHSDGEADNEEEEEEDMEEGAQKQEEEHSVVQGATSENDDTVSIDFNDYPY